MLLATYSISTEATKKALTWQSKKEARTCLGKIDTIKIIAKRQTDLDRVLL